MRADFRMKTELATAFGVPSAVELHEQSVGKANTGDVSMRAESAAGQNPVRRGPTWPLLSMGKNCAISCRS